MNGSDAPDILEDEEQQREDCAEQQAATLKVDTLEPRILLSATWADADSGGQADEAALADDGFADDATGLVDALTGDGDGHDLFGGDGDGHDLFGGDADDDLFGSETDDTFGAEADNVAEQTGSITEDTDNIAENTDGGSDPRDVVLIDSNLSDADALADAVEEGSIVIRYDGADGTMIDVLGQVEGAAEASGCEIASLTVLSHGSGGQFDLGGEIVSADMTADQEAAWQALSDNFTEDANVYIYGCDVVDGSGEGQALLDSLAELTDAEVFGSTDTTGAGSDWDLEAVSAGGEAELAEGIDTPLDIADLSDYDGTLSTTESGLWLSTDGDVSGGGAPGDDTWTDGEAVEVGDPNLDLGETTNGTFSGAFNLDNFAGDGNADIDAMHYVSQNITIGVSNTVDLQAGDILLSTDWDESISSTTYRDEDIFVFRPDTEGDYSSGTFFLLFDGSDEWGSDVEALTLIEQDTEIGGVTYGAGSFLLAHEGNDDVLHYEFTSAGSTTNGSASTFLDVSDINISNRKTDGLDLIETETTIGGETLQAGELLISLKDDDSSVGDNSISTKQQDVVKLNITATGSSSAATASTLLDGSDVGLDAGAEDVNAFTLFSEAPDAADDAVTTTEDIPVTTG